MHLKKLLSLANKLYAQADYDSVKLIKDLVKTDISLQLPQGFQKTAQLNAPTIILIRHGETSFNSSGDKNNEKLRGWLDVPLNEEGYVQAEKLAQYLMHFPVSRIIASDLNRTRETANAIARYTNADIHLTPSLRPWNLGAVMGKSVKEYVPVMLKYIQQDHEVPPDSTESFHMFQIRFLSKMQELMQEAIEKKDRGIIVAVAHSRNSRALRGWIMAGAKDVKTLDKKPLLDKEDPVKTGHFMAIQFDGKKWNIIEMPNQEVLDK